MEVLCFTENSIICYAVKRDAYDSEEASMGYIVTKINFVLGDFIKANKAFEYVTEQRKFSGVKIEGDREALI